MKFQDANTAAHVLQASEEEAGANKTNGGQECTMELHCCNIGVQQKTSVMLRPSVLPERSKSIMKSTAKTLVPAGPACDQRGARSRQAAGGAAGQAWLRAAVPKKEVCRHRSQFPNRSSR